VLYLTGKSTGQIQVVETLRTMTSDVGGAPLAVWHVRNKLEHCVNSVFQCVREACAYLDGAERRWPESGLARFYLLDNQPRDLPSLRSAGIGARICPYEITRAALTFNDVWIGDYNYVFSPGSRGLFYDRPGFDPARTLVVIDEAHNLPSRAADAHSHSFSWDDARAGLRQGCARPSSAPTPGSPQWDSLGALPRDAPERQPFLTEARAGRGCAKDQLLAASRRAPAPTPSTTPPLGRRSPASDLERALGRRAARLDRAQAPLVEPGRRRPLDHLPRCRAPRSAPS
jgi:hypothetical protein